MSERGILKEVKLIDIGNQRSIVAFGCFYDAVAFKFCLRRTIESQPVHNMIEGCSSCFVTPNTKYFIPPFAVTQIPKLFM